MIDEIKNQLSNEALAVLEALSKEYKDDLINKAYQGLLMSGRANDTITAKDIIKYHDAKTDDAKLKNSIKEIRRKRIYYLAAFVGILYSLAGVFIYFIMDRKLSILDNSFTLNISFMIIIVGLFFTAFSIFFERYYSLRKKEKELHFDSMSMENIQWEIVKKWTRIENTANDILKSDSKNTSSMLNWLTSASSLSNDSKIALKKLLTIRNQIVHAKPLNQSKSELKNLSEKADDILGELANIEPFK